MGRMIVSLSGLLITVPLALGAQGMRTGDRVLLQADLDDCLRGRALTFFDQGVSTFYPDGRYTYTYANEGGTGYGYFEVGAGGQVCVDFVTGFARCDLYVIDPQGRFVVITEAGDRFPVRQIAATEGAGAQECDEP